MIREIHDQVVQRLFGVSLALGSDGCLTLDEQHRCGEEITGLLGQLRAALARPVSEEQSPELGDSRSFRELVEWFAESDSVELTWQPGVEAPAHLEPMARSAVVEALRNAEKHSRGGKVEIRVAANDGTFSVEVGNDRIRRAAGERSPAGGGLGLRLLTLEALQQDALVEFGPVGEDRWRFRLLAPDGSQT
jgi:signal transduction histidine kinase